MVTTVPSNPRISSQDLRCFTGICCNAPRSTNLAVSRVRCGRSLSVAGNGACCFEKGEVTKAQKESRVRSMDFCKAAILENNENLVSNAKDSLPKNLVSSPRLY